MIHSYEQYDSDMAMYSLYMSINVPFSVMQESGLFQYRMLMKKFIVISCFAKYIVQIINRNDNFTTQFRKIISQLKLYFDTAIERSPELY